MSISTNTEISTEFNLHPRVLEILAKRGYSGEMLKEFLSWDLKGLNELTQLKDLAKASARIIEAIEKKEKVGVYGDYDVDGTTSCALLYYFFEFLGVEIETIQPSRFVEGYGIHASGIDDAINRDVKVLITVDCGISNNEAADYALERGLDLIITDHHKDAREEMPKAFAVINPNRRDENNNNLKALAGVGVAFALALQIKNDLEKKGKTLPTLYPLLQFVAIGTICDLAPLNIYNIRLVRHGLKQLLESKYEGIRTFFTPDERSSKTVLSEKLAFYIGPLINSKGRLDHPEYALKTLTAKTHEEAFRYFSHLEQCNSERKYLQSQVYKEARDQVIRSDFQNLLASVVYKADWHEGVIGIVASQLVAEFKVPAVVFTNSSEPGIIKASARTAGHLDLFATLDQMRPLFTKFGGHKAAAGLSMPLVNFPKFLQEIHANLKNVAAIERTKLDIPDCQLLASDISPKLMHDLEKIEPYGGAFEKPLFVSRDLELVSFEFLKDIHVRWTFQGKKDPKIKHRGISFSYLGKYNCPHPQEIMQAQAKGIEVKYQFRLGINRFKGNEYIQLQIDDVIF
jgi:single-stranded-DNA-specific exonuclease